MTKDYETSDNYRHRPYPKFPLRDRTHRTHSKRSRLWKIEYKSRSWRGDWKVSGNYRTEDERDKALKALIHKLESIKRVNPKYIPWCRYRKLDPDDSELA